MVAVDPYVVDMKDTMSDVDGRAQQQAVELQAKPFISLLNLIGEIYQVCMRSISTRDFFANIYFGFSSRHSLLHGSSLSGRPLEQVRFVFRIL